MIFLLFSLKKRKGRKLIHKKKALFSKIRSKIGHFFAQTANCQKCPKSVRNIQNNVFETVIYFLFDEISHKGGV